MSAVLWTMQHQPETTLKRRANWRFSGIESQLQREGPVVTLQATAAAYLE